MEMLLKIKYMFNFFLVQKSILKILKCSTIICGVLMWGSAEASGTGKEDVPCAELALS